MPIASEFSLQNSTIEIFDNSSVGQQTALSTLRAAIKVATNDAARIAAYNTYFADANVGGIPSGTITITTAGATANASYAGTWANASGAGFWISTSATATTITANLYVTTGTITSPLTLALADLGNYWTSGNATKGTPSAVTTSVTLTPSTGGNKISKITAIGETGKAYATISAKLVSESGTIKAKGSSDEGDLTVDYLSIPSDLGQTALELAFDDETINGNRVFRVTHNASGAKVYLIGMVSEIKKSRGAVDNFSTAKAKIILQDGVTEYNP